MGVRFRSKPFPGRASSMPVKLKHCQIAISPKRIGEIMTLNQKCGKLLLCSAVALLAGASGVSQSHPASNSGSLGGPAYGGQQPNAPDPAEDQMNRDRAFLKKALEGGSVEVRLGELAQQNSQRDDVKQFGRR